MRKFYTNSIAVVCGVAMLYGCGRNGNPIAPAPITPTQSAVRAIQIAGRSGDSTFTIGQTVQLSAVAQLFDGSEQDITSLATWTSDNPSAATVSSGLVTAVRSGAARVRASYQNAEGEAAFTIVEGPAKTSPSGPTLPDSTSSGGSAPPPSGTGDTSSGTQPGGSSSGGPTNPTLPGTPPTVQRLVVTGEPTVAAGKTGQFRAIAYMSDGSQKDVTASSDWRSDNSLIGSISQAGVFTGVMPGSNVVTANYNGASASQPVQVTPF